MALIRSASLEASNEYSHNIFSWRGKKNITSYLSWSFMAKSALSSKWLAMPILSPVTDNYPS